MQQRLGAGLPGQPRHGARARVAANGICQPGRLRVEGGGTSEEWTLAAPDCRVDQTP